MMVVFDVYWMGGCCAVVQSKRRKEMMAMQKKIESGGSSGVGNSGDGILDVASALSNDTGYGESLLNMLDENDDDDVEELLAALNPRDTFLQR